jgi:predicted  nucleic acid-binding Zn-ribbon protein
MSGTLNLYRLQTLDTRIDQIEKRLIEIKKALSDDQLVVKAEKAYIKAQKKAKEVRIKLRMIEDKVEAQRIKRKSTQEALFGGKVRNPKELEDLQMESEALKRYISQLEDEQLDAMIANEAAEQAEIAAKKNLAQARGTTVEENAELLGEKENLENEWERLIREKEAVLQAIPPENLKLYQKLRKLKHGTAVATVSDGGCSICGQALTPADQQAVRASNRLVFCPSCGRILFEG